MHRDIVLQYNQRDTLISQIYYWNRTLHFSDTFSVRPKHVDFYSKNKFHKLVQLVGFIIGIYISYFDYALSLKKAFIARTCCRLLVMDEVVFKLHLYFFLFVSIFKHYGDVLPKNCVFQTVDSKTKSNFCKYAKGAKHRFVKPLFTGYA